MAFRASNQSLQDVLVQIKRTAFAVKRDAAALRSDSGSQATPFVRIQDFYRSLQARRADMTARAATPGLAAYAKDQENDQSYDVVAEFNVMRAAIVATEDWIVINMPATIAVSSSTSDIVLADFSPGAMAGLRTQLDALIAAID